MRTMFHSESFLLAINTHRAQDCQTLRSHRLLAPLSDVTDGTNYISYCNDLSYRGLHNTVSVCHYVARGPRDGSRE